ncbi:MAG: FAD-dependent oxidoreductase, partial [Umezawaea sp.]
APDLRVNGTSLFTLLRTGKHVPLDFTDEPARHRGWEDVRGALVRPDGHVAWASDRTAAPLPTH